MAQATEDVCRTHKGYRREGDALRAYAEHLERFCTTCQRGKVWGYWRCADCRKFHCGHRGGRR